MPTESRAEADRRQAISDLSYKDYLSNTEKVKKDIRTLVKEKSFPGAREVYNIEDSETIGQALSKSESHLIGVIINMENIKKNIVSNLVSNEHLDKAIPFYKNKTEELDSKMRHKIIAKEKVNKRMVNFYNKDSELKKDIIYYLKIFYVFFVLGFIALIIHRREHKNKKLWAFVGLLFLIPFYGIHKIYIFILENIGHFKLDILYISLLTTVAAIIFGVFKLGEFSFKKSSEGMIDEILEK